MSLVRDLGALGGREHDVLVVGGGIYGAAAAWEAAQRGLSVALVERSDFGSGTSWNSLRTIHGGLRHLQRLDMRGVRESARERRALLRIAPELVRPLSFMVPVRGHGARGREAFALGLWINDLLTADRNRGLEPPQRLARGRLLSRRQTLARVPGLEKAGLTGAALWSDAQVTSSERLLVGFLLGAAASGAVTANYAEAIGLLVEGGRVRGARVLDGVGGSALEVRARTVLLAAGPDVDRLWRAVGLNRPPLPLLEAMNVVLDCSPATDLAVGASSRGRYLFLVPWRGRVVLGTDYGPAAGGPVAVEPFLAEADRAFPWAGLGRAAVTLVHRGRVPGTAATDLWTRNRLVDHEAGDGLPGLVSMIGVKLTTARALAEKAVDLVLKRSQSSWRKSRTATSVLLHAVPSRGTLAEQTRTAVREEMALHLGDVVLRRLDLGITGPPPEAELRTVATTMATELGWDAARAAREREELTRVYVEAAKPIEVSRI